MSFVIPNVHLSCGAFALVPVGIRHLELVIRFRSEAPKEFSGFFPALEPETDLVSAFVGGSAFEKAFVLKRASHEIGLVGFHRHALCVRREVAVSVFLRNNHNSRWGLVDVLEDIAINNIGNMIPVFIIGAERTDLIPLLEASTFKLSQARDGLTIYRF